MPRRRTGVRCWVGVATLLAWLPLVQAAETAPLWSIGVADGDNAELALAPKGYARFAGDPVFIVGVSRPERDWPYAQPGPVDTWGGRRPHTFTVRSGLAAVPPEGRCRLELRLLETHPTTRAGLPTTKA